MERMIDFVESLNIKRVPYVGRDYVQAQRLDLRDCVSVFHENGDDTGSYAIAKTYCKVFRFAKNENGEVTDWLIAHSPEVEKYMTEPLRALGEQVDRLESELKQESAYNRMLTTRMDATNRNWRSRLRFLFTGEYHA